MHLLFEVLAPWAADGPCRANLTGMPVVVRTGPVNLIEQAIDGHQMR